MRIKSRNIVLVTTFLWLTVSFDAFNRDDHSSTPDPEWFQTVAREYLTTLKQTLMQQLRKGPLAAVQVCSDTAQKLNQIFSQRFNATIRRVSLNPRNPADTADEFERRWLQQFEQMNRAGIALDTVNVFERIDTESAVHYRFLKPIAITTAICLYCHGPDDHIQPEVLRFLQTVYPKDQARGHKFGDLRGALSITVTVPKSKKNQ